MEKKNAIIVGGSTGMGFGAARYFLARGGRVLLCSRSADKLRAAQARLEQEVAGAPPGSVATRELDNTDEAQVKGLFECLEAGVWDALVVTALGRAPHGPFLELDVARAKEALEGKLWGPWFCAKYGAPKLRDGGGIVFCSGVLCRRPGMNCAPLGEPVSAAARQRCTHIITCCVFRTFALLISMRLHGPVAGNGAVEALTRSLALELGPRLRVNCFAPGYFDTERYDHLPPERKVNSRSQLRRSAIESIRLS
jgi:NAD(P)-dependent dehydrogenase (short-subunit alcohol dehydrogenase family)